MAKGNWKFESPAQKVKRFCGEMQSGQLKPKEISWRAGYIAAHQQHTDLFLLKQGQKDKVKELRRKRAERRRRGRNK